MAAKSVRQVLTLHNAQITADTQGAPHDAALLEDLVAEIRAVEDVAGTLDGKIEDSFDDGVTWNDWIVFTQLTTTGAEAKGAARPPGGLVRANLDVTGGTWSVSIRLSANPKR